MDILDLPKKFHNRTYLAPGTGCWISLYNAKSTGGYAQTKSGGKRFLVHRFVYEYLVGKIPNGLFACHKCDVRACCNPNHIFLGTNSDNQLDASRKGRLCGRLSAFGEKHGRSKLSQEAVRNIREEYKLGATTYRKLAKKYNISRSSVGYVLNEKTWRHLLDGAKA